MPNFVAADARELIHACLKKLVLSAVRYSNPKWDGGINLAVLLLVGISIAANIKKRLVRFAANPFTLILTRPVFAQKSVQPNGKAATKPSTLVRLAAKPFVGRLPVPHLVNTISPTAHYLAATLTLSGEKS